MRAVHIRPPVEPPPPAFSALRFAERAEALDDLCHR